MLRVELERVFRISWSALQRIITFFAGSSAPGTRSQWAIVAALTGLLVLAVMQYWMIFLYGANFPSVDGWTFVHQLQRHSNSLWDYFTSGHGHHRTVWTRVQVVLLYALNGWDGKVHLATNLTLLIATIGSFLYVLRPVSFPAILSFYFLFSAYTAIVHSWPVLSHFIFYLFFLIWTAHFLVGPSPRPLLAGVLGIATLYSSATALGGLAGLLIYWGIERGWGKPKRSDIGPALIALTMALWVLNFSSAHTQGLWANPWTLSYWNFFIQVLALPVSRSHLVSPLVLVLVGFTVAVPLWLYWRSRSTGFALYFALLFSVAVIALGRGQVPQAGFRYVLVSGFLLAIAIHLISSHRPRSRGLLALLVLVALPVHGHLSSATLQRLWKKNLVQMNSAKECVRQVELEVANDPVDCGGRFRIPLRSIRLAREWKLSFLSPEE